ncbi:hypothetical protein BBK82_33100 [Lentzea guizhouensis]|uniref:Epoxide hydrolase N-terminal domain-containing protein n=1 Tax=Lentzea guizhouensis TaxID=1586287 RepID=A0A1B2HQZ0_9PSEU|nr:hypothetical protein [Lentzea guizhouensis]ANZ40156.1 hypothetical protein BBK82_33100 [Lentzea guizhouensis]
MMGTRPQTLMAFADSPIGLASFLIDHNAATLALITRVFDGHHEGLTRQDVVENASLHWLANSALSAARLYWESKYSVVAAKGVTLPAAVSVFPEEVYQAPRSWAEQAYPNLIHYNRLPRGGHFAAWAQPQLLAKEIRAGFRPLRQSHTLRSSPSRRPVRDSRTDGSFNPSEERGSECSHAG